MGQMKETLHDSPELEAYQAHNERLAGIQQLVTELLGEVSQIEFTTRILRDNLTELYSEMTK